MAQSKRTYLLCSVMVGKLYQKCAAAKVEEKIELPNNSETEVLGQQYEHWGELFGELEDEDVP